LEAERKRNNILKFRVDDREKSCIEYKKHEANSRCLSDYLRRMALCGKVYQVDMASFRYLERQLAGACNNINQLARAANAGGTVSQGEIAQVKQTLESIYQRLEDLSDWFQNGHGSDEH